MLAQHPPPRRSIPGIAPFCSHPHLCCSDSIFHYMLSSVPSVLLLILYLSSPISSALLQVTAVITGRGRQGLTLAQRPPPWRSIPGIAASRFRTRAPPTCRWTCARQPPCRGMDLPWTRWWGRGLGCGSWTAGSLWRADSLWRVCQNGQASTV